jgi:hypothetical protein
MSKSKLANTELKEILDTYDKDFQALVKIKPKQFDTTTVATMISAIPERKWNAAQGVVNATIAKKDADNRLKAVKATKMLEASYNRDKEGLTAAEDRKAYVENHQDVQSAEIDSINADAELLAAKLAYECLDDLFTAGKKIMDWLSEQDRATQQYNRFADEGRKHA